MRSLLFLLGLNLMVVFAFAQPKRSVHPVRGLQEDLIFKRYGSAEGLPDNRVRSFLQDKKGFSG
ncbi:hypothetical protein [Siphonobacter sp. SORGH_AS_0500]|uniref:hypothetical protein n=1 Tax=Siphonobacter sp. SORGH_AS_0500 TaxID=1864824 RepID=UPI0012FF079B|nr:hypothetical protein [Siphonobacter sp. SORGH_AS_0500]